MKSSLFPAITGLLFGYATAATLPALADSCTDGCQESFAWYKALPQGFVDAFEFGDPPQTTGEPYKCYTFEDITAVGDNDRVTEDQGQIANEPREFTRMTLSKDTACGRQCDVITDRWIKSSNEGAETLFLGETGPNTMPCFDCENP